MKIEDISLSSVPQQTKGLSLILALVAFLFYLPLQSVFTPNDHEGYEYIIQETQSSSFNLEEAKGKVAVAIVYSFLNEMGSYKIFTLSFFLFFLFIIARHSKNIQTLLIYFILLAPISPYFWYITKEAILLFIVLFSIVLNSYYSKNVGVITFVFLILIFSYYIRIYYAPLILISFFLYFNLNAKFKLVLFLTFFIAFSFSSEVIYYIYEQKYLMWARLYYYSDVGTLFFVNFKNNPNVFDLIYMALSNYLQILYTPLKFFDHRGLIVLIHISCFLFTLYISYLKGNRFLFYIVLTFFLFIAYMVPDSGTFIRHSSALTFILVSTFLIRENNVRIEKSI